MLTFIVLKLDVCVIRIPFLRNPITKINVYLNETYHNFYNIPLISVCSCMFVLYSFIIDYTSMSGNDDHCYSAARQQKCCKLYIYVATIYVTYIIMIHMYMYECVQWVNRLLYMN